MYASALWYGTPHIGVRASGSSHAAVARGEGEVKLARGELCVLVKHLVKIAQSEKQQAILVLFLYLVVLPFHRRELSHFPTCFLFFCG